MQLFVDLDGVMADLDAHHEAIFGFRPDKVKENIDWKKIQAIPHFYANIPPMQDLAELWDHVEAYDPIVLTGVPFSVETALADKRDWVIKHLGSHIRMIGCKSVDKCLHGKRGDILIDDWEKHQQRWIDMGGRWITHVSAVQTIDQLEEWGLY